jgi:hypothetical protein
MFGFSLLVEDYMVHVEDYEGQDAQRSLMYTAKPIGTGFDNKRFLFLNPAPRSI